MMKTRFLRLLVLIGLAVGVASVGNAETSAPSVGAKKGPTTKIYLSETEGESAITSNGVAYTAQQAKAFDAPGTVIETKEKAHNAFVYSNGTGLYMEPNTRIKIDRFAQERFQSAADRTNPEVEPSPSQSTVLVTKGTVGICTNQLAPGSTMVYTTPLAIVNIRRGRLSIETSPTQTIVDLLEGDITVRADGNQEGQILHPGDRAIVQAGAPGQPSTVTIVPTPKEFAQPLDERTNVACNAKKTVFFDVNDAADQQQITANPTVPAQLPTNLTVSPDRLSGTP